MSMTCECVWKQTGFCFIVGAPSGANEPTREGFAANAAPTTQFKPLLQFCCEPKGGFLEHTHDLLDLLCGTIKLAQQSSKGGLKDADFHQRLPTGNHGDN